MGRLTTTAAALVATLLAGCAVVPVPTSGGMPSGSPAATAASSAADALTGIRTGNGTLYVADGVGSADRDSWTTRLRWVVGVLAVTDLGGLDAQWDGRLDVELPTDSAAYRELAGADADGSAAVTRCADDVVRVTVNPRILSQKSDYLDSLLLHEGVHVAMRSPCSGSGPLWVKEGLAEWVAGEHSESTREANLAWVKETLRTDGVPQALPDDAAFSGTGESAAYALASLAVAAAVGHGGSDWAMGYFQRALTGGASEQDTATLVEWYRADLEAVASA